MAEGEETRAAMMVIDTAGCDMGEQKDEAGSTFNEGGATPPVNLKDPFQTPVEN